MQVAAAVHKATSRQFPQEICNLVADYAIMLSAGDWCLMQQPDIVGYKIGVITHVVQRSFGVVQEVHVHECSREVAGARHLYTLDVQVQLQLMDDQRGPMATLHAPRYNGQNPFLPTNLVHGDVDVFTDTGRVPFRWVRPVILNMEYVLGNVPAQALGIVASGDRVRMEAMLQRLSDVPEENDPEVPEYDRNVRRRLA